MVNRKQQRTEAATRGFRLKAVFKLFQYSQENTCVGISFNQVIGGIEM